MFASRYTGCCRFVLSPCRSWRRSKGKNSNIVQTRRRALVLRAGGPVWAEVENNSRYQKPQRFFFFLLVFAPFVSSPVDRNLRSRQECARAWRQTGLFSSSSFLLVLTYCFCASFLVVTFFFVCVFKSGMLAHDSKGM